MAVRVRGVISSVLGHKKQLDAVRGIHKKVGIVGVPFDKGQARSGVALGPDELRRHGLLERIKEWGCEVTDHGNISYNPLENLQQVENMKHLNHVAACHVQVSRKVQEVIEGGELCVTLGGDHSVSVGSVDGHQNAKKNISIIWVDAHADINTSLTSPTGNIHGMPMGLLTKELAEYWPELPGMEWQEPRFSARNLAYIGLRDVDPYERFILNQLGIASFGMEEVESMGITTVFRLALRAIDPHSDRSLHLSFDVDALDPLEAPSTGTPVRGGLSLREGFILTEMVAASGRLGALDIVEFNPQLGDARDVAMTAEAASIICVAACAASVAPSEQRPTILPKPALGRGQRKAGGEDGK